MTAPGGVGPLDTLAFDRVHPGDRLPELRLDVCAACHPAYTGVERAATTGTRVERFERRRALARR